MKTPTQTIRRRSLTLFLAGVVLSTAAAPMVEALPADRAAGRQSARNSRQTGRQGNCRDIEKWINRPIPAPYLLKNETDWKLPSESDYPDFFNAE